MRRDTYALEEVAVFQGLSSDVLERLKNDCQISVYPEGTTLRGVVSQPLLVLDGMLCARMNKSPQVLLVSGNLILPQVFFPDTAVITALSKEERSQSMRSQRYTSIGKTCVATFSFELFDELLNEPVFSRNILTNNLNLMEQMGVYQRFLYHSTAKDAVEYILKLSHALKIDHLTHSQIAFMTGRNRTTVTKAMHEIALSNPKLFEEAPLRIGE